ncbi:MAG: 7TM diverse intracellular signaling domain-containing protein, partial [Chitinivibrionales bacterium]
MLVVIFNTLLAAQTSPLVLGDHTTTYRVDSSLMIFEDSSGDIAIEQILTSHGTYGFKPADSFAPNMGFSSSAFWLRLDIQDSSTRKKEWVVDLAMPSLHNVDFFITRDEDIIYRSKTGFLRDKVLCPTPYRNPALAFTSSMGRNTTVYARVKSQTPIILPVTIRERNSYIEYDRMRDFFLGFYFGILLIMAVYHLYLFFSTNDRSHLWLVLFTLCFGIGQITASYGFLRDWGFTGLDSVLNWLHIINYFAAFYAVMVSRSMVQSWRYTPLCDKFIKMYLVSGASLAILSPLFNFMLAARILVLLSIFPLPFLVYAAVIGWRNKLRSAIFYIIAAIFFIIGIATYNIMYGFGVLPFHEIIFFLPNLTFVISLALFSFGMADRIKNLTREKEKARERSVRYLRERLRMQEAKTAIEHELEHARKMET